ncbi:MAG: DUF1489 domain-containing protein [Bauldia litoralis]
MPVHLLKLCVGVDSIDRLATFQARRLANEGEVYHKTRNAPRRADEVLDGGSIYWIIKGFVRVRQRIVGIERQTNEARGAHCHLVLDPELVPTAMQPRRPHQGWRYLEPADAPADAANGMVEEEPPPEMAEELRELGLL